eukprot:CAMPEP_0197629228 /NCGR_PEP_ID=MMETSP1338-20131121/7174_1 /TAXON_ID=43686 ORGANISM="Pelagodinium beii, Strain RCC1491" /NCGR_SAMPLE_ID=MMETSP1338 /ASSEMBLY_ACC=CAM_ASM_000754 /LENGTH=124 /DNA_ID=CAMNT_0043200253 /DNA_START=80 /DNA_END=454 /DNA_ORIENTATION=-
MIYIIAAVRTCGRLVQDGLARPIGHLVPLAGMVIDVQWPVLVAECFSYWIQSKLLELQDGREHVCLLSVHVSVEDGAIVIHPNAVDGCEPQIRRGKSSPVCKDWSHGVLYLLTQAWSQVKQPGV